MFIKKFPQHFWFLVSLAFLVRIVFVLTVSPYLDTHQPLSLDAQSYHLIAQNVVERRIFTSPHDPPYDPNMPGTFRPPLTPLYLAAIYAVCGVNILWGRIGLALVNALACGLTFWLGRLVFNRRVGLIAGLIGCVYPFFFLLVHLPLTEGISILLTTTLLVVLYTNTTTTDIMKPALLLGGIVGGLLLNKASNIVVIPTLLYWSIVRLPGTLKQRILGFVLIVLTATVLMSPWIVRNYRVTGAFFPVNSNGGWTFYLGNNPHVEQNLRALEQGTAHGWVPPDEVFQPFSDLDFSDTRAYEHRAIRLAFGFILENPAQALNFAMRKLIIFWSPYQHIVDTITWIPVALLSLIGLGVSFQHWRRHIPIYLLIGTSILIPICFTAMPRFRAPLLPCIFLYSAAGLLQLKTMGEQFFTRSR